MGNADDPSDTVDYLNGLEGTPKEVSWQKCVFVAFVAVWNDVNGLPYEVRRLKYRLSKNDQYRLSKKEQDRLSKNGQDRLSKKEVKTINRFKAKIRSYFD